LAGFQVITSGRFWVITEEDCLGNLIGKLGLMDKTGWYQFTTYRAS